ncbi:MULTISPECIES: hypothetical protein [unclassified Microbulbifer]|uniref:hypothetical protein n=1 Tax=unclassified Microbulbifer TaxID=2619833 RepID=UPI0027E4DC70|nr:MULTISPECIES: hypothetical protein [unclassified Microbulbifer]
MTRQLPGYLSIAGLDVKFWAGFYLGFDFHNVFPFVWFADRKVIFVGLPVPGLLSLENWFSRHLSFYPVRDLMNQTWMSNSGPAFTWDLIFMTFFLLSGSRFIVDVQIRAGFHLGFNFHSISPFI